MGKLGSQNGMKGMRSREVDNIEWGVGFRKSARVKDFEEEWESVFDRAGEG